MNSKVFALLLIAALGVYAEEYNCAAEGRVCQNGGICHDTVVLSNSNPGSGGNGWATPTCICKAPYGGPDCSYTIRECKDSPCQNGGTCRAATCRPSGSGSSSQQYDCFTCECPAGFAGAPFYQTGSANVGGICDYPEPYDCRLPQNMCQNGGVCSKGSNGMWRCACTAQWAQSTVAVNNCTTPVFNCTTLNPCQNGGTCVSNGASCSCQDNYQGGAGNTCTYRFCDSSPCQNGGTCNQNNDGTGSCSCTADFRGTTCGQSRFCSTNPCQNGGTCSDDSFPAATGSCSCPTGFQNPATGLQLCQLPVFCASNPCQNGATCTNGANGMGTCSNCPAGFAGQFCEIQLSKGCSIAGCYWPNTQGYNAATPNTNRCPCYDQASCATRAPGNTATTGVTFNSNCACDDSKFAYDCGCNSTYVPKCPSNAGIVPGQNVDMVCQNGATCVEHAAGTACACRPGFWGESCENYDNPCLNNPCKNQGKCSLYSETSSRKNPLSSSLESVTVATDDRFWAAVCTCKWPYYGETCEQVMPRTPVVCTDNQCQNGATCSGPRSYSEGNLRMIAGDYPATAMPYVCNCAANYTGIYCQTPIVTCGSMPDYCQNGGSCVTNTGNREGSKPGCVCPCGYAGDRCEIMGAGFNAEALRTQSGSAGGIGMRGDFCAAAPCQNGGSCVNTPNGRDFWCLCKSGYGDRYCGTKVRSSAAGVVPSLVAVAAAVAVAFALKH